MLCCWVWQPWDCIEDCVCVTVELGTVGLWPCSALALAVLDTATVLGEGTSVALSSAPDESDYQTEFEEELPDISKETYADFQSTGIELDSDSVRCWALFWR